jgi:tetratricopeptide (TPR) repeat protein
MTARISNSSVKKAYKAWPYLLIGIVSVLAYLPTFSGTFILDDKPLIKYNTYITQLQPLHSYLSQEDGIINKDKASHHTGYYRPLINLSYWIDYQIWGMEGYGFRITNLIFHVICCFLLFRYLSLFNYKKSLAVWGVLLFALHPVHTEAVSWVTSRNNILVSVFGLSSLVLYMKAHEKPGLWIIVLSTVFFTLALFSKEYGVMLLPIIWLYRQLIGKKKRVEPERGLFYWYIPFTLVLLFYFILRQNATTSWLSPEGTQDFFRSLYFTPYLFFMNVQLLLAPYNLHSFALGYPASYTNPMALLGIGFFLLFGFYVWKKKDNSIITFSLISFLIAIFPVMNIVSTSAMSLISMRWLYFPSIFLGPLACLAINKLLSTRRTLTIIGFSFVFLYFSIYSYVLNNGLWHNEEVFFLTEINEFHNSYYAYGYALQKLEKEEFEEAEKYFKIAIDGYHSRKAAAYIEYSGLLNQLDRPLEALDLLRKDSTFFINKTQHGQWYNNLGMAFFKLGRVDEAIESFRKSVRYSPNEPLVWANLGGAYGSIRAYSKSLDALEKGLHFNPDSVEIRSNLANTYIRMHKYEEAMDVLSEIEPEILEEDKKLNFLLKKIKLKLSDDSVKYN